MSTFRIRYETRGKHTQLRLFVSPTGNDGTWNLAGRLTMRNADFSSFRTAFEPHVQFVPEPWQAAAENAPIEQTSP